MGTLLLFTILFLTSCGSQETKESTAPLEKLTVAVAGPVSASVYVAAEKRYFEDEGLDVTLSLYESGKASLDAVLEGSADVGTTAETPIMHAALKGERIYALATIQNAEKEHSIVARTDRDILKPEDLKGKRIGLAKGTSAEFYTDTFLILFDIAKGDVEFVNLKPSELVESLISGEVDAVTTWRPHLVTLQDRIPGEIVSFTDELQYTMTFNLAGNQEYFNGHKETMKKMLRALLKAKAFMAENQDESIRIVADYTAIDEVLLAELWKLYSFDVHLDQSLLIALEDQARWAIKQNLTDVENVPNYLDYLYLEALEEVSKESVTVIR